MLTSRFAVSEDSRRQGCKAASLAELRRALSRPSSLSDGRRQRLLDLVQRLAAVQRLGGGLDRVDMSDYVRSAVRQGAPVTT
jgi:hypothetical protein